MSDQGFDFGPAPPRREARQFEPPPWERDQFEQHKREQAEREAAAREARAWALAEQEAIAAAENAAAASQTVVEPIREQQNAEVANTAGEGEQEPAATPAVEAEVDEKQVALMMLGLRAEEPTSLEGAWLVNAVAGGMVAVVGLASVIWGVVALTKRGMPAAGTLGGFVLSAFGLGFLGVGGWLIFKALRQRGVL